MDIFSLIAEDKIRRAIEEGEFDNLPGKGKPLKSDDLAHIPEDLRVAYRVMRNANMINDADQIKQELISIEDLLRACESQEDRLNLLKEKRAKELKLQTMLKKRKTFEKPASSFYKEKILEQFKKRK